MKLSAPLSPRPSDNALATTGDKKPDEVPAEAPAPSGKGKASKGPPVPGACKGGDDSEGPSAVAETVATPAKGSGKAKGPPTKGPPPPGHTLSAGSADGTEASTVATPAGKGPAMKGGKGPPAKGYPGATPEAAGVDGAPPSGKAGAPPVKGKPAGPGGKGPAGGKGKSGGKAEPRKPKISPGQPLKPIWWKRYVMGVDLQPGTTIWDAVEDDASSLPIAVLEERFSKAAPSAAAKPLPDSAAENTKHFHRQRSGTVEEFETEKAALLYVLDLRFRVGREPELKKLPPAADVSTALDELMDEALTLNELDLIRQHACPEEGQVEAIRAAQEKQPELQLPPLEEYLLAVGRLPAHCERLECWSFVRGYRDRTSTYTTMLEDFLEVVEAVKASDALLPLLGLVLATGNYLNGGGELGQADGFQLGALEMLASIQDEEGHDIRRVIFQKFLRDYPADATALVRGFGPVFSNVGRGLTKDGTGLETLNKVVRVTIEDCAQSIRGLQEELATKQAAMETALRLIDDPASAFSQRMPRDMEQAKKTIGELAVLQGEAKAAYEELLELYCTPAVKSSDFFLMWDNLFVPCELMVGREKECTEPFCRRDDLFTVDELKRLWHCEEQVEAAAEHPTLSRQTSVSSSVATPTRRRAKNPASVIFAAESALQKGEKMRPVRMTMKAMCQLPWTKLTFGVDMQPGDGSIWDRVEDLHEALPVEEIAGRFDHGAVARLSTRQEGVHTKNEDPKMMSALAQMNAPEQVAKAIWDFDVAAISLEDLTVVKQCMEGITDADMERLSKATAKAACSAADAMRLAVLKIPLSRERIGLWHFARASDERVCGVAKKLFDDFLDIVDCFENSEALPALLGLLLATGNHLNGGSNRGQADAFELRSLGLFEGVKDNEGRDSRHFVFDLFFHQRRASAMELLHEMSPCFLNVSRTISKDTIGTEILTKAVAVSLERGLEITKQLQGDLEEALTFLAALDADASGASSPQAYTAVQMQLKQAQADVEELLLLQSDATARYEALLARFKSPKMPSDEFCLLWDDFFLPADLMCNKGQERYFTPAFCSGEPFGIEPLLVLWNLESSSLSSTATGSAAAAQEAANKAAAMDPAAAKAQGLLDAEAFCRALMPCLLLPDDFDSAARAYSVCLGTRDLGGDLGDVERGQMHAAIDGQLFDPELELGKALGPVRTNAGWHLLWAQQKTRGILSTTVRASHILITEGWHEAPMEEESLALAPDMDGEERAIAQTWRRWSFYRALPSALARQRSADDDLLTCREALRGRAGLRLLFRWSNASIFSVKGVLSDVARDMVGTLVCSVNGAPTDIGRLLTADEAVMENSDVEGFHARLLWKNDRWQEAANLLDESGSCNVQIALERRRGDKLIPAGSTLRLRVQPTALAYAASEAGLRLALCSSKSRHDCCATLTRVLEDGRIAVTVDNAGESSPEKTIDPKPSTVVRTGAFSYEPGARLLVLLDGKLQDATCVKHMGSEQGNRHSITVHNADEELGVESQLDMDLNEMNHSVQRFESAAKFEAARWEYCNDLKERGVFIEDAITGNRLSSTDKLVRLTLETRADSEDATAIARMAFDDLEWVSGGELRVRDRVWAQGREGYVEHLQRHGKCIVRLSDGSATPPLCTSHLKKARPIAGVQHPDFFGVQNIAALVCLLTEPNRRRHLGAHDHCPPVLVRAGPGTGKTWSMQQLLYYLARQLGEARPAGQADPVPLVPLLIPIQKLARMLRQRQAAEGDDAGDATNLVLFYICNEYPAGPTRDMLVQAFELRALIVLLDGVDEAANVKQAVENFVTQTLVPTGIPLVLTSRPEGIRKRLYARDFVIMNLQPLSPEEQHDIAYKQLVDNVLFEKLASLTSEASAAGDAAKVRDARAYLASRLQLGNDEKDLDRERVIDNRLAVFKSISSVPVFLSVLVCALSDQAQSELLPRDIFDLYELGVKATLRRHFGVAAGASNDEAELRCGQTLEMLRAIATANHLAARRTFQPADVRKVLSDKPALLQLWEEMLQDGNVPLVKILALGESGGEFQFRHLSFQESLFGSALATGCDEAASQSFWGGDSQLCSRMNDPFYRNCFALCRGHLGQSRAKLVAAWSFDCQPRLTSDLGHTGLRHLLPGALQLQALDLSNVGFEGDGDLQSLVDSVGSTGLPALTTLKMRCCKLPGSAASALGTWLSRCPAIRMLDLEGNRELLRTTAAVDGLCSTLSTQGLPSLEHLSLRWCQVPGEVGGALARLFAKCPRLTEVDLLGSRRLRHEEVTTGLCGSVRLKGVVARKTDT
eukprot:TRINITY_DN38204_c0_g3_i1.p1 TRINITY_DN38204_c0_g3~~TRINITY_DN38204_c0_g3_i1.p1  ORF type:complete len:2282 (+),score=602.47 TRINITY_DN38204_c0_g3_i1:73-6918(+)